MSSEAAVPVEEAQAPVAKNHENVAPVSESTAPEVPVAEPKETESAPIQKSEPAAIPGVDGGKESAEDTEPLVSSAPVTKNDDEQPAVPVERVAVPSSSVSAPLLNLYKLLPAIYKEADYREMWGVELSEDPETHVPTSIIVTKFLRANANNVGKAKEQLIEALQWRKKTEPLKLLESAEFDKSKYGNLGFVTSYEGTKGKEVVTWNIYGAVKDNKATFGDVDGFVKWRAALMELSIAQLSIPTATVPIPESGPDPYRMIQVHDYLNVSFLRMDPAVKAASKQTIQVFSMAYPEVLKEKFFVNVPLVMSWVFSAMKLFLSAETVKKFHPLGYGEKLASELPEFGEKLPKAYGGKGESAVTDGLTVKYTEVAEVVAEAEEVKK